MELPWYHGSKPWLQLFLWWIVICTKDHGIHGTLKYGNHGNHGSSSKVPSTIRTMVIMVLSTMVLGTTVIVVLPYHCYNGFPVPRLQGSPVPRLPRFSRILVTKVLVLQWYCTTAAFILHVAKNELYWLNCMIPICWSVEILLPHKIDQPLFFKTLKEHSSLRSRHIQERSWHEVHFQQN